MDVNVQLHASAAPPGKGPSTHCRGGWVNPRASMDVLEKRKVSDSCRDSNSEIYQLLVRVTHTALSRLVLCVFYFLEYETSRRCRTVVPVPNPGYFPCQYHSRYQHNLRRGTTLTSTNGRLGTFLSSDVADVSSQHIEPIFEGRTFFLDCMPFEDGTVSYQLTTNPQFSVSQKSE